MAPKRVIRAGKRGTIRFGYPNAPTAWDKCKILRDRVLAKKGMVRDVQGRAFVTANLQNCKLNKIILREYMMVMKERGTTKIGVLAELAVPLQAFAAMQDVDIPFKVHQDSWAVKRLLSFLRRKWNRDETPRDTLIHIARMSPLKMPRVFISKVGCIACFF